MRTMGGRSDRHSSRPRGVGCPGCAPHFRSRTFWGRGTRWSLHPGLVKSITDDFWRSILHDQQYASTELLQNCRGPVPVVLGGGNPLFKPVAYPARDASTDGTSLLREVSFFCPVPPSHRTTGQLYRGVSTSLLPAVVRLQRCR